MTRLKRNLVRFLALALSPVLIVSIPNVAIAEPLYGPAATASWSGAGEGLLGSGGASCEVVGYFAGDASFPATIHADMACATGWGLSSAVVGWTVESAGCSYSWVPEEVDGEPSLSNVLVAASGYDIDTCNITELCWTLEWEGHSTPWATYNESGCVPFLLGSPPDQAAENTTCDYATVSKPVISAPRNQQRSWEYKVRDVNIQMSPGDLPNGSAQWRMYVVFRSIPGQGPLPGEPNSSSNPFFAQYDPTVGPGHTEVFTPVLPGNPGMTVDTSYGYYNPPEAREIIGVGLFRNVNPGEPVWPAGLNFDPWGASSGGQQQYSPNGTGHGWLGRNIPGACAFYWGEKIVDRSGDETDKPNSLGALPGTPGTPEPPDTDPPDPESEDCNFSITDPSTWAGAGICALVGLFDKLLDKIKRLLRFFLNFFTELWNFLVSIFVPSDGYLDGKVTDLRGDLDDSAPGQWLGAFTDQDFTGVSASGCSGIPVDWSIQGQSYSFDLLAACSGYMATAASVVKLAASALLVLAGGLACLRGLGSGFGWSPSMGRGGSVPS